MPTPPHPPTDPPLRVEVFTSWDAARTIRDEWLALARDTKADIYTGFDSAEIWWRYYAKGQLAITAIRAPDNTLLGVIPFTIETLGIAPFRIRVARIVGSYATIVVLRPAVRADCAAEVYAAILDEFLSRRGCDAVAFTAIGSDTDHPTFIHNAIHRTRSRHIPTRLKDTHTVFSLPATFDAWVRSLSKNARQNYRSAINRLRRKHAVAEHSLGNPRDIHKSFETFAEMHAAQWEAAGLGGHFEDWPHAADFARDLNARLAQSNRALITELTIDNQHVAGNWCFIDHTRGYFRLPARKVGEPWDSMSIGRLSLADMVHAMIEKGVTELEGGPGGFDYKTAHNAREYTLHSIIAARPTLASRLKAHALVLAARLIDLAYFKVWRLRLARRFGLLRRPLWQAWIRTRL